MALFVRRFAREIWRRSDGMTVSASRATCCVHRPGRFFNISRIRREIAKAPSYGPPQEDVLELDAPLLEEEKGKFPVEVRIDRRGLLKRPQPLMAPDAEAIAKKSPKTPLVDELLAQISVRGPIPVHTYMSECLSNPRHGYYMKGDVFGAKGDFVTSPEISQVFGELVGVWCLSVWMAMNEPKRLHIVELGPGRGTLMADILRVARQFPAFQSSIAVHLLENSPALQEIQRDALTVPRRTSAPPLPEVMQERTAKGIPVQFHSYLRSLPTDGPMLFIAHEFFDALPVHQFEYTERGWREIMIDQDVSSSPYHFRRVLSSSPTPASTAYLTPSSRPGKPLSLLETGPTEQIASNLHTTSTNFKHTEHTPRVGDRVEICPGALAMTEDMAKRIAVQGGGALIFDYGDFHPHGNTLQGVKSHQYVDILTEPGLVDLTAHVDFASIAQVASRAGGASLNVFPLATQTKFLMTMGLAERVEALIANASDEQQAKLVAAAERLVDPEQMGSHFKVLCFAHKSLSAIPGFTVHPGTQSAS